MIEILSFKNFKFFKFYSAIEEEELSMRIVKRDESGIVGKYASYEDVCLKKSLCQEKEVEF